MLTVLIVLGLVVLIILEHRRNRQKRWQRLGELYRENSHLAQEKALVSKRAGLAHSKLEEAQETDPRLKKHGGLLKRFMRLVSREDVIEATMRKNDKEINQLY